MHSPNLVLVAGDATVSRHFLVWSSIGGTMWSVYTCGLAYLVGTALAGFPLASVLISGVITTLAMAVVFVVARRYRGAGETRPRPTALT